MTDDKDKIISLAMRHEDAPDTGLLLYKISKDVADRLNLEPEVVMHDVALALVEYANSIIEHALDVEEGKSKMRHKGHTPYLLSETYKPKPYKGR